MDEIRVLIVDDEPLARLKIRTLIENDPEIKIIGECRTGEETISAIIQQVPDLVFLDIQLPEKNGFEIIEEIGPMRMPAVIIVTAYQAQAIQVSKNYSYPYVLKPVDSDQLLKILAQMKQKLIKTRNGTLSCR